MSAKFPRGGGANPFSAIRLYRACALIELNTVYFWYTSHNYESSGDTDPRPTLKIFLFPLTRPCFTCIGGSENYFFNISNYLIVRALTRILKTGVTEPSLPKSGSPTIQKYIASFKNRSPRTKNVSSGLQISS